MLIVSADDWGYSPRVTAAIDEAFDHGAISSTSAMVWQADSSRAADLARERRHAVGLHLNLTVPLRTSDAPARVRARQSAVTERFDKDGWRAPGPFTGDRQALRDVIRDQLDRFREEVGEPTHVDGHHHVHAHPAVLEALLEVLPTDMPVRNVPSVPGGPARDERQHAVLLTRWFAAPDVTWELRHLLSEDGRPGLSRLDLAREATVEVVTHPVEDRDVLLSAPWRAALASFEPATYRDVAPLPPARRERAAPTAPPRR